MPYALLYSISLNGTQYLDLSTILTIKKQQLGAYLGTIRHYNY